MTGKISRNNLPARKTDRAGEPSRRTVSSTLTRATTPLRSHPRLSIGTAVVALAVASGATLLPTSGGRSQASVDPRTRVFANYSACLLTGPGGVGSEPASGIWKGMQQASGTTNERVTNQPVLGTQTIQNTEEYINTLAALRCRVVITIGQNAASAAIGRASAYPDIQFISVAAALPSQRPKNLGTLPSGSAGAIAAETAQALVANYNTHSKA